MKSLLLPLVALLPISAGALHLQLATSGGNASSPLLYGLLYEDVYHSGDGGLYSELLQNRAFQGADVHTDGAGRIVGPFNTLRYWHTRGADVLTLDNSGPALSSALPYHMRVDVASGATGETGFWNEGFWGINITTKTRYSATFHLRGTYHGEIKCAFWSNTTDGMLGSTTFQVSQDEADGWRYYAQTFTTFASAPDHKNTFHLTFDGAQVAGRNLRFNLISSFQQTFKDSNNGLRMDLAQALNDLGGKFLRFPGGNNLEGQSSPWRLRWDQTIGPITDRPGRPGTWGYYNTDGLGLLEMMQWTLDMNLEPILAVWGGLYLDGEVISDQDLQQYIDDAMNELEFLLGPSNSKWGAVRASLGYPTPFSINYVEISNEDYLNNGLGSYVGYRFQRFYNAIKARYPNMKIISSVWVGNFPSPPPAGTIQDLHDYLHVSDMVSKFGGYDHADRKYPVLVGEYAAIYDDRHQPPNQLENPTLQSATSEAVYFLGLERNADLIVGIAHGALIKSLHDAPNNVAMLKHTPNQIVYSMSYLVTKLFATHYGSETVPITSDSSYGPLYWAATKNKAGTYFLKIVNYDGSANTPVTVTIPGKSNAAKLITLTAPDAYSENTLESTTSVWTETSVASGGGGTYTFTLKGAYVNAVLVV